MQLRLEELPYQQQAINSVVRLFEGQERNTFDNATDEGIRFNYLRLSHEHLADNTQAVAAANGIDTENLKTHVEPDFCIDMEVPGYIRIGSDGTGRFHFGLVSGDIDGRVEQCGNTPRFEFSWSGQEENDPVCGRGWGVIENGELCGRIYLHLADDSAFRATKSA